MRRSLPSDSESLRTPLLPIVSESCLPASSPERATSCRLCCRRKIFLQLTVAQGKTGIPLAPPIRAISRRSILRHLLLSFVAPLLARP
jgi:hypothetical protein